MKFGVFDHVDRGDLQLAEHYESRLQAGRDLRPQGFYAYQIAEHHATPLGMAARPASSCRPSRSGPNALRIGTLVYTLTAGPSACAFSKKSACSTR